MPQGEVIIVDNLFQGRTWWQEGNDTLTARTLARSLKQLIETVEALTLTEIDPPLLTKTDPPSLVLTQSDPVDKDAVVRFHCGPRCSTPRRVLARANGEWMGRPEAALREQRGAE